MRYARKEYLIKKLSNPRSNTTDILPRITTIMVSENVDKVLNNLSRILLSDILFIASAIINLALNLIAISLTYVILKKYFHRSKRF